MTHGERQSLSSTKKQLSQLLITHPWPLVKREVSWRKLLLCGAVAVYGLSTCAISRAQFALDQPPIDYYNATPHDPITKLQERIEREEVQLTYEPDHGYLKSVLDQLNILESSQVLVFSKTSFQQRRISPHAPRALYFNDDVYVGWVRNGDMMEFSSVDPKLGANFYTLNQSDTAPPRFQRHTHECLQCHGSTLTRGIPGHLVRSVYPNRSGRPILRAGTFLTDQSSPLQERWGGWYVTGRHGRQRHLGNLVLGSDEEVDRLDMDAGANVTSLSDQFQTHSYLNGHSDIVALMVLEHQVNMHNRITQANYAARLAQRDQRVMNEMLDRPLDFVSDSIQRRFQKAAEPVVRHMLFVDETRLTDSIEGTSEFADAFAARGVHDATGRSLRQFDLKQRLFRYPCSYLVYSAAFDQLPAPMKDEVLRQLWEVLTEENTDKSFRHLSSSDRKAILEILRDTKTGLPDYWNAT